ncbi:MAG: tyrosine recombinase XerC [Clostridiaceae bacterium]|nr:tyrosine recombinase XerC [Clostridiaceae bacterium]
MDSFRYMEEYLGYMEAILERSPLTVREYRYDLVLFFRYLVRERDRSWRGKPLKDVDISVVDETFLQSIHLQDLYAFITYVSRVRKGSPATRARKIATLRSFFKYLKAKSRILEEDPSYELETPKLVRRLPRYLSLEESQSLLNTASESDAINQVRDTCILTLFLNCGMRLSELCGISLGDIREDTLTVLGKGAKERTIYLNPACMEALEDWLKVRPKNDKLKDPEALFTTRLGTRISSKMVQVVVKRSLRQAGLDPARYSTHKLRHTAATLMYKYGKVDIRVLQRILGHESVSTTEIYTHVDNEQLHTAVDSNPLSGRRHRSDPTPPAPDGTAGSGEEENGGT